MMSCVAEAAISSVRMKKAFTGRLKELSFCLNLVVSNKSTNICIAVQLVPGRVIDRNKIVGKTEKEVQKMMKKHHQRSKVP